MKRQEGQYKPDKQNTNHRPLPNASVNNVEIYICTVCGENMGKKQYACSNLRQAQDDKCGNIG